MNTKCSEPCLVLVFRDEHARTRRRPAFGALGKSEIGGNSGGRLACHHARSTMQWTNSDAPKHNRRRGKVEVLGNQETWRRRSPGGVREWRWRGQWNESAVRLPRGRIYQTITIIKTERGDQLQGPCRKGLGDDRLFCSASSAPFAPGGPPASRGTTRDPIGTYNGISGTKKGWEWYPEGSSEKRRRLFLGGRIKIPLASVWKARLIGRRPPIWERGLVEGHPRYDPIIFLTSNSLQDKRVGVSPCTEKRGAVCDAAERA